MAKGDLVKGEFGKMIETDLPFGARTARMLIAIGRNPQLTNRKHVSVLPPHWGTLHTLTKLTGAEYEFGVGDGMIRADMQRADVQRLIQALRDAGLRPPNLDNLEPGKFSVLYADPPWRYEHPPMGGSRAIEKQYPTLTLEEICALPIGEKANQDSVLFLWATSPKLPGRVQVIQRWGFNYRTSTVWVKDRIGTGYYVRGKHELLLIAKRGKAPLPPATSLHTMRPMHSPRRVPVGPVCTEDSQRLWRQRVVHRPDRGLWLGQSLSLQLRAELLLEEPVERLLRLPHVQHPPAAVHRASHVKDAAGCRLAAQIEPFKHAVVLLLGSPRKLKQKGECHDPSSYSRHNPNSAI